MRKEACSFLKKRTKRLLRPAASRSRTAHAVPSCKESKVFCFFSPEKKAFLPRRTLLALCCLVPTYAWAQAHGAVLSDADEATLVQVGKYLNSLKSLKGRFLQVGPDGKTTQGTMWLERPGRMRFQYDKPSPLLLVAGNGIVTFYDSQLGQTTNMSVGQTPLGLLLADTITLSGDVTVTDFQRQQGQLFITLVRTKTPGDGSLTLMLNTDPLALVGWSVVDAEGRETRLRISNIQLGGTFDESLFHFTDPDAGK
jgi:outer membrane lipoprotein-sorting protein